MSRLLKESDEREWRIVCLETAPTFSPTSSRSTIESPLKISDRGFARSSTAADSESVRASYVGERPLRYDAGHAPTPWSYDMSDNKLIARRHTPIVAQGAENAMLVLAARSSRHFHYAPVVVSRSERIPARSEKACGRRTGGNEHSTTAPRRRQGYRAAVWCECKSPDTVGPPIVRLVPWRQP